MSPKTSPKSRRLSLTIREMPDSTHREWKALSALRSLPMDETLIEALNLWVAGERRKYAETVKSL